MHANDPIATLRAVSKRYGAGERTVWALRDLTLDVAPSQFLVVMGPSGSGKSTLLNLLAGLDVPDDGEVRVAGRPVAGLPDAELSRLRRRTIAFVFQFFNLLPTLDAWENVAVPLRADGVRRCDLVPRVTRALEAVGIAHRAHHYPDEMSGGEMQRVAIARALATDARLLLADEPTGNLDTARSQEILALLRQAVDTEGRAIVMVTHDSRAAQYGDRVITLSDGRIAGEEIKGLRGGCRHVAIA
jgi:putative ABC transport system ATP-binding protein